MRRIEMRQRGLTVKGKVLLAALIGAALVVFLPSFAQARGVGQSGHSRGVQAPAARGVSTGGRRPGPPRGRHAARPGKGPGTHPRHKTGPGSKSAPGPAAATPPAAADSTLAGALPDPKIDPSGAPAGPSATA